MGACDSLICWTRLANRPTERNEDKLLWAADASMRDVIARRTLHGSAAEQHACCLNRLVYGKPLQSWGQL